MFNISNFAQKIFAHKRKRFDWTKIYFFRVALLVPTEINLFFNVITNELSLLGPIIVQRQSKIQIIILH